MKLSPARVLFEDNHLIAVSKLPGELSQGDKTGDAALGDLVKDFLKEKYAKPGNVFLGVAHRLDRPVSGVMLFAKTSKALERLNAMLRGRDMRKIYWAVVGNTPPQPAAALMHYLTRNEQKNTATAHRHPQEGAKEAKLTYKCLKSFKNRHLLEVELETGRHHQIRAQLAAIGCPIVGDLKYGYPEAQPDASILLHARLLEFTHPVKQTKVSITAPLPENAAWKLFAG